MNNEAGYHFLPENLRLYSNLGLFDTTVVLWIGVNLFFHMLLSSALHVSSYSETEYGFSAIALGGIMALL